MTWIWIFFGVLVLLAGVRYRHRLRAMRRPRATPTIDDDAIRHIIGTGRLPKRNADARLDMKEAERAEEEFWAESWDEPDEYRP
jgi:hypothetical protein